MGYMNAAYLPGFMFSILPGRLLSYTA